MRFFFILALGRSGTALLSSLLARAPGARVHHEPSPLDPTLFALRHAGFHEVVDGMLEQRFAALLPQAGAAEIYGEVNSYLRYESEWLRRRFDPVLIHLIRDGRDFVRSAYVRAVYTPSDYQLPIVPRDGDLYARCWARMSRFEHLCWYWHHTNSHLAERIAQRARLEEIVADYAVFRRCILEPIGIEISEATWRSAVRVPKNTSSQNRRRALLRRLVKGKHAPRFEPLPHWSDWSADRAEKFWAICGETMEHLGYSRSADPAG